jgi:hypothetical protein
MMLEFLLLYNILEVYEYNDYPLLFVSKTNGNFYLCMVVDDNDNICRWLVVKISEKRFKELQEHQIDLHNAFVNAEEGIVLLCNLPYNKEATKIDYLKSDVLDDLLPESGIFVTKIDW